MSCLKPIGTTPHCDESNWGHLVVDVDVDEEVDSVEAGLLLGGDDALKAKL